MLYYNPDRTIFSGDRVLYKMKTKVLRVGFQTIRPATEGVCMFVGRHPLRRTRGEVVPIKRSTQLLWVPDEEYYRYTSRVSMLADHVFPHSLEWIGQNNPRCFFTTPSTISLHPEQLPIMSLAEIKLYWSEVFNRRIQHSYRAPLSNLHTRGSIIERFAQGEV